MFWADRLGKKSDAYQATLSHNLGQAGNSSTGQINTALWYTFNQTGAENALVDPALGVSKIWFMVKEKGRTKTYNKGGIGFPIQDTLLLGNVSCLTLKGRTDGGYIGGSEGNLTVAVSLHSLN
jgi:hypothetical protein